MSLIECTSPENQDIFVNELTDEQSPLCWYEPHSLPLFFFP